MKKLRELIRDLREDHKIKQKTIASYLDVSQQTYSNYESGRRDIPTWVVVALAQYYKVSTDYLLSADSGYLGSTNLKDPYLDDITLHDVMFDATPCSSRKKRAAPIYRISEARRIIITFYFLLFLL